MNRRRFFAAVAVAGTIPTFVRAQQQIKPGRMSFLAGGVLETAAISIKIGGEFR